MDKGKALIYRPVLTVSFLTVRITIVGEVRNHESVTTHEQRAGGTGKDFLKDLTVTVIPFLKPSLTPVHERPVMVAVDKHLVTVETAHKRQRLVNLAQGNVAQVKDNVIGSHSLIPTAHNLSVHVLHVRKRAVG
jgi:hypothetical protein